MTGKAAPILLEKSGNRFVNVLKREATHENEPQRILFLVRIILLVLCVYYLIFPVVMYLMAPGNSGWLGIIFELLGIGVLYLTYTVRVHTSVILCVTLQLGWVICHLILYGWDCGIQHLMFSMIVLTYFSLYNALLYKVLYTVLLFAVRFGLFMYCRIYTAVYPLSESATVTFQILSTILTFVLMGITCGMFSSNVESAEKKLVLYNESLKRQAATDPLPACGTAGRCCSISRIFVRKSQRYYLPLEWEILIFSRRSMITGDMTVGMQFWCGSQNI